MEREREGPPPTCVPRASRKHDLGDMGRNCLAMVRAPLSPLAPQRPVRQFPIRRCGSGQLSGGAPRVSCEGWPRLVSESGHAAHECAHCLDMTFGHLAASDDFGICYADGYGRIEEHVWAPGQGYRARACQTAPAETPRSSRLSRRADTCKQRIGCRAWVADSQCWRVAS